MSDNIAYVLEKIAVLWDENVEFSKGAPLSWDEFIAGFTPAERKIYNDFA